MNAEQGNAASVEVAIPCGVDEMKEAGLEAAPSVLVRPPRVKASPCAMECKWLQTLRLDDIDGNPTQRYIVFGQGVGTHIDERFIREGLLDTAARVNRFCQESPYEKASCFCRVQPGVSGRR